MSVVVGTPPGIVASGYSRSAVKIPTSGMACWWDATDPGMFSYGNGTDPANPPNLYVSEWRDQSGAGNHAVASLNQAFQPRRNGSINGLPAVNYSGDGAYNTIGKGLSVPAWLSQTTKPISHFVLFRTGPTIYSGAHLIAGDGAVAVRFTTTGVEMLINGVAAWATVNGVISPNSNYLLAATYSATGAWELRINGTGSTGLNDYAVRPGFTGALGSSSDQGGSSGAQIGEAIVYNRVLSGSEIATVEAYLDKKWGGGFLPLPFPLTLPWHSAFWASDPKWSKPADGGAVPSWRNAGTSGVAAVQPTPSEQPKYRAAYANLNSKPAVEFAVTNWLMAHPGPSIAQPNHVVLVGWLDPATPVGRSIPVSGSTQPHQIEFNVPSTAKMYAGGAEPAISGGARAGVPYMAVAKFDGATSTYRINGTDYPVPGDPGTGPMAGVKIGGYDGSSGYTHVGGIAFLGVCDRALTAAEIEDLENWARAFYGVPVTPPFPTTGLQGWWDASDDSSFDVGLAGAVPVWRDKSGNNRHATAPAGMVPYRTGTRNGRDVVTYYNTTHRGAAPVTAAVDNYTIFAVGYSADQSSRFMFYNGDNGSANGYGPTHSYGGKVGWLHGGVVWGDIGTPSPAVGSWNVFAHQRAAGVTTGYVNGVAGPTTSTGAPNVPANGFSISGSDRGAGGVWLGDIAEIIVYDRALSAAERNQVTLYLAAKWNIPLFPQTGLAGWFDANDASTFDLEGQYVVQWRDKVKGARAVITSGGAARPTRSGARNGVTSVVFDGVDDYLFRYDGPVITDAVDDVSIMVAAWESGPSASPTQTSPFALGNFVVTTHCNSATKIGWLNDGVSWNTTNFSTPTTWCTIGLQRKAGVTTVYLNGVADTPTSASAVSAYPAFSISPMGRYLKGEIGEIIVHDQALSAVDLAAVHTYLATKWGIA